MGATKFQLVDFEEEDYRIFAVHTALPGFRLAFLFNQLCGTYFIYNPNGFEMEKDITLSYYQFYDDAYFMDWKLIENKFETPLQEDRIDLFAQVALNEIRYLVPEFQKANYIIKVTGDESNSIPNTWLNYIKKSAHIQSAYEIPKTKVKKNTKKNLIF